MTLFTTLVAFTVLVALSSCGASSNSPRGNLVEGGECIVESGENGYWEISDLPVLN